MKIGTVFGDGVRAYVLESVSAELVTLRGTPEGKRQTSGSTIGSRRMIPTEIFLDLFSAIVSGKISVKDVNRKYRRDRGLRPLFEELGLDHDPFLLGYDSTIEKVLHFLSTGEQGTLALEPISQLWSDSGVGYTLPKPFLLLAGISGTGKTWWVLEREVSGKGNVKVIPVRPDWHEPSDLLGYVSRISNPSRYVSSTGFPSFLVAAWRECWSVSATLAPVRDSLPSMTPFWVCLDEMNLAPVEQYFADYLSVLERRTWSESGYCCPPLLGFDADADLVRQGLGLEAKDPLWLAFVQAGGIPLPPNLVVVGTVNMDETTHGFSRKVLDRALTVEFDAVDFSKYGGTPLDGVPPTELPWIGLSAYTDANTLPADPSTKEAVLSLLESWNAILDQTAFRIAYRTINESLLIAASLEGEHEAGTLDWVVMTKLLPRLEGDEEKLLAPRKGAEVEQSFLDRLEIDWQSRFGDSWQASRTCRKLQFMKNRLTHSGFTSFWP